MGISGDEEVQPPGALIEKHRGVCLCRVSFYSLLQQTTLQQMALSRVLREIGTGAFFAFTDCNSAMCLSN